MLNVGAASYSISSALFLLLTIISLFGWRQRSGGIILAITLGVTTLWAAAGAYQAAFSVISSVFPLLEIAKNVAWLTLFFLLVQLVRGADERGKGFNLKLIILALICAVCALAFFFRYLYLAVVGAMPLSFMGGYTALFGHVILAVAGLVLVEQLARNIWADERWVYKFLCLGGGSMFGYDLFLYSEALLFGSINPDFWNARGVVSALAMPLIAISMQRNRNWAINEAVSHRVVFYTVSVISAGIYLLIMAVAGYYIQFLGGDWGGVIQAVFFMGALILLLVLMFSGQIRAYLKVYLAKNFFAYKYDYREQWITFIRALSMGGTDEQLRVRAIKAIADIVESSGGALWLYSEHDKGYKPVSVWDMVLLEHAIEDRNSSLVMFMEKWQWVVNLNEYKVDTSLYRGLNIPPWLSELQDAWLVVPLMRKTEIFGFVVLAKSRGGDHFNWEDIDLLRIAGRELSSYLALLEANQALLDARQFEAFNRLSAYVVHDLKNVVGQLSLVVENAKKFKDKPEFIDDAFGTVNNSLGKMNRMLLQLKGESSFSSGFTAVKLGSLLKSVVESRSVSQPVPSVVSCDDEILVLAEYDRMLSVIEHLVQNAQEASDENGRVEIRLASSDNWADITIEDSGSGMDKVFIRERLFRPFDTTKGNAGMGIGVYEAREFISGLGGTITVDSKPQYGTKFLIRIPRYNEQTK